MIPENWHCPAFLAVTRKYQQGMITESPSIGTSCEDPSLVLCRPNRSPGTGLLIVDVSGLVRCASLCCDLNPTFRRLCTRGLQ